MIPKNNTKISLKELEEKAGNFNYEELLSDATIDWMRSTRPDTVLRLIAALRDCVEAMQRYADIDTPIREALARIRAEVDFE